MRRRKWWNGTPMVLAVIVALGLIAGLPAGIWAGIIVAIVAVLYWLPALIARARYVPNTGQVVVVNLFGFLAGVPWIIALVMAAKPARPA